MAINRSKIGEAFVSLTTDNNPLKRGLKSARSHLRRFGSGLQGVGQTATGVSGTIFRTIGAIGIPFALAVRSGMQFQDVISEVGAVSGATAGELEQLRNQAKELGRTTSFTASQVGGAQAELGRAGFDPKQIQDAVPAVLALARATKTELPEAAGIAASSLRQFGMDASETGRVADVLATTANKSFNTLETIGESMKFAGPVADDFNMSIEETAALVGALGNVGIQGSLAGTAIRRLLTVTGADAEKLKEIFGVEFESGGDARKLVESLADINDATADLGTAERSAKFKEAFGLLGITGASALSKNVANVRELMVALDASQGSAQTTAEAMDDNLGGSFRFLLSAVEGVAIALTDALSPTIRSIAGVITEVAGLVSGWIDKNKQLVVQIFAGVAAVAVFAAGLLAAGIAVGTLGIAVSGLATLLGILLSPGGLVAGAILGIGTAFAASNVDAGEAIEGIKSRLSSMVDTFKRITSGLKAAFDANRWDLIGKIAVEALKLAIREGLLAIGHSVAHTFEQAKRGAMDLWNAIKTGDFSSLGSGGPLKFIENIADDLDQSEARLNALLAEADNAAKEQKRIAREQQEWEEFLAAGKDVEPGKGLGDVNQAVKESKAEMEKLRKFGGLASFDHRAFLGSVNAKGLGAASLVPKDPNTPILERIADATETTADKEFGEFG